MSTAVRTAQILSGWREAGPEPLPDRLAAALERAVLEGRVAIDARIPSERELAGALGVSRATVSGAYAVLRADGWLATRRGAGSVARIPAAVRDGMAPSDAASAAGVIDLRRAAPEAPVTAYRAAMRQAIETITPELTTSVAGRGSAELRERIAERHRRRGVKTTPDQILITNGAMPGLWLVLAALLPRAPRMLVEHPTYPGALDALRHRSARVLGWPVLDGWDLDELERLARQHRAAAAYLVPDFQNPTGQLMPPGVRRELTERAERLGMLVVVDETMVELDLRDDGAPALPAPSGPSVVTLGSLSKAVWDGVRVGWIRAEADVVARIAAHPLAAQMATAPLDQAVAAALLGDLDAIVEARRRTLRSRRDRLLGVLDGTDGIHVARPPEGGLSLWATLERASSSRLAVAAAERGVLVDPGGRFAAAGGLDGNLRLPYSLPAPLLDTAVERLAPLLRG